MRVFGLFLFVCLCFTFVWGNLCFVLIQFLFVYVVFAFVFEDLNFDSVDCFLSLLCGTYFSLCFVFVFGGLIVQLIVRFFGTLFSCFFWRVALCLCMCARIEEHMLFIFCCV